MTEQLAAKAFGAITISFDVQDTADELQQEHPTEWADMLDTFVMADLRRITEALNTITPEGTTFVVDDLAFDFARDEDLKSELKRR